MTVKSRIIYFYVKIRIIFHILYTNGKNCRKTAFYVRNFPGNGRFLAGNRNQEMVFFDQEFGVSLTAASLLPKGIYYLGASSATNMKKNTFELVFPQTISRGVVSQWRPSSKVFKTSSAHTRSAYCKKSSHLIRLWCSWPLALSFLFSRCLSLRLVLLMPASLSKVLPLDTSQTTVA